MNDAAIRVGLGRSLLLALAGAAPLLMLGCQGAPSGPASGASASGSASAAVTPADLDRLIGPAWHGSLTYLDYGSGMHTEIPSTLLVRRAPSAGDGDAAWIFAMGYDNEPQANNESTMTLSAGGHQLDGETVIERTPQAGGAVRIVTEVDGQDDNKPARVRHVLTIGDHECTWQKLVKFNAAADSAYFERNIYRWKR